MKKISIIVFVLMSFAVFSQNDSITLKKEENLVLTDVIYTPSVSDAFKINMLPKVEDTEVAEPDFTYSIVSNPVETNFDVMPITAAKMKGDVLPKLYRSLATVGFGNYTTTLANFKFNSTYSKKYKFGMEFDHFASLGKVRLENDEKVPATFSRNGLALGGTKFFKNASLVGNTSFYRKAYRYYGYYPELDTTLTVDSIKQRYLLADLNVGLVSSHADSSKLLYSGFFDYKLTQEKSKVMENQFGLNLMFKKYVDDKNGTVYFNNRVYDVANGEGDSLFRVATMLSPVVGLESNEWKVQAGFKFIGLWSDNLYGFYPIINFDFNVADNILVPYVRFNGDLKVNDYRSIINENPFINPSLNVKPTRYRTNIIGGFRGKFTQNMPYNISVQYSRIDDMYFWVNDFSPVDSVQNQFSVVYDNTNFVNGHVELGYEKTEKIFFLLKGDYDYYSPDSLKHPWHKPNMKVALTGKYNIDNKIIVQTDIFYTGARKAYNFADPENPINLKGFADVNLALEYRYTKILSAFLNINNIAAMKYQQWNFYPNHRFNVLLGVTYAIE